MTKHSENETATLWAEIESLKRPGVRRFELGARLFALRQLYSERERRKSGGLSAAVGHGEFQKQCAARGFAPRTVRDLINDFTIEHQRWTDPCAEPWARTSAEKRQEQRRTRRRSQGRANGVLAGFAAQLTLEAAHTAYKVAARALHPDCGGSNAKMQQLNVAWERVKPFYEARDSRMTVLTS